MSDPILDIRQVAMGCKPDPFKFDIVSLEHVNGHTIIVANYGGLTFGGNKLMVLRGVWDLPLESLDPHFLGTDYPVMARFQPTPEGNRLARLVCHNTPAADRRQQAWEAWRKADDAAADAWLVDVLTSVLGLGNKDS